MSLYYLYNKYKMIKIKWIYDYNNPANLMTKNKVLLDFKTVININ